jgi:hypothetical protein
MDRANAIRLLKALVAAGAGYQTPMAREWTHDVAGDLSLQGADFASAVAHAEGTNPLGISDEHVSPGAERQRPNMIMQPC